MDIIITLKRISFSIAVFVMLVACNNLMGIQSLDEIYRIKSEALISYVQQTSPQTMLSETSDWVVAMYIAGDNDLSDELFADFNEAEYALYLLEKEGFIPHFTIVALLDSVNGTHLYELGPDSSVNATVSPRTKDLTSIVPWLDGENTNTGDAKTLESFIIWVQTNFDRSYTMLQFSSHGGGPRSTEDISQKRRAMCWDTSEYSFMTTREAALALSHAPRTIDVMLLDVCFGSSIEDAYEFRNSVDFMVASPSPVPGEGLNYTALFLGIKNCAEPAQTAIHCVDIFSHQYTQYDWASLSALDLSKVVSVKNAIDSVSINMMNSIKEDSLYSLVPLEFQYEGTFAYLYDIGALSYGIKDFVAVDELQSVLDDLIINSWKGGSSGYGDSIYGVVICGEDYFDFWPWFYPTELSFGVDSQWKNLLYMWYPLSY